MEFRNSWIYLPRRQEPPTALDNSNICPSTNSPSVQEQPDECIVNCQEKQEKQKEEEKDSQVKSDGPHSSSRSKSPEKSFVLKVEESNYNIIYKKLSDFIKAAAEERSTPIDVVPEKCNKESFTPATLAPAGNQKPNNSNRKTIHKAKRSTSPLSDDHPGYPKLLSREQGNIYILGPNGTTITEEQFNSIKWNGGAPVVTRSLLKLLFSNDELATNSLTGKPSPAFYGRERPPKGRLDPIKVKDITICVRNRLKAKERDIRAAITTKCADVAKRQKAKMESSEN